VALGWFQAAHADGVRKIDAGHTADAAERKLGISNGTPRGGCGWRCVSLRYWVDFAGKGPR
jgi:hypothetical protein